MLLIAPLAVQRRIKEQDDYVLVWCRTTGWRTFSAGQSGCGDQATLGETGLSLALDSSSSYLAIAYCLLTTLLSPPVPIEEEAGQ